MIHGYGTYIRETAPRNEPYSVLASPAAYVGQTYIGRRGPMRNTYWRVVRILAEGTAEMRRIRYGDDGLDGRYAPVVSTLDKRCWLALSDKGEQS